MGLTEGTVAQNQALNTTPVPADHPERTQVASGSIAREFDNR